MPITAASIEANGWVLAITHNRGLGSFASYALTPDATPALTLTSRHAGYDLSGGVAVANVSKPRSFIATNPLRKAAVVSLAGALSAKVIDETDNGGGSVTVRIALSNWVFATDTSLLLTYAAGWRNGETTNGTIAVINNSTAICPVPIHRHADVPYRLRRTVFTAELLVFGFFPQGNQPVAAVKCLVTDGTTVKTYWAGALTTSTQFGDNLRCYTFPVDPTTATALTAGLLRVDYEVYPWIGAIRSTDPAGTRSMATLSGDGWLGKAQTPYVVAWDPTGARYPFQAVYVDFTNGTNTTSTAMIGTGSSEAAALAAAKAVPAANRARDVLTAIDALALAHTAIPAANGQPGGNGFYMCDGGRIVLAPQVHAEGLGITTGVRYGARVCETFVRIEGDPAASNGPRTDCVLRTKSNSAPGSQGVSLAMSNMSIELGYYLELNTQFWWFDNVELRGQAGFTTDKTAPTGGSVPAVGSLGLHLTNSRLWKSGVSMANLGISNRAKLIRHCEHRRVAEAPVCVSNRVISETEDSSYTGSDTTWITGALSSYGSDLSVYDSIVAYCDLRGIREEAWNAGFLQNSNTANPAYTANQNRRQVFFGNVAERIGPSSDKMFACGEQQQADMADLIVEANTIVGDRANWGYNDATPTGANTAAGVTATDNQAQNSYGNARVVGNIFALFPTKHDRFNDPAVKAQRVAAGDPRNHGMRPQNVNAWASLYGVGMSGNVNIGQNFVAGSGGNTDGLYHEYEGLGSVSYNPSGISLDPKYTNDQSCWRLGVDYRGSPTGSGDYTPLVGSPALARVSSGNSDRDLKSAVRNATFAAGAIEGAAVVVTSLVPALARHPSLVSSPSVQWRSVIAAAPARQASRVSAAAVAWSGMVAGTRNALATRAGVPMLGWTASLVTNRSVLAMRAGTGSASWTTVLNGVASKLALPRTPASLGSLRWTALLTPAQGALTMRAGSAVFSATGSVPPSSLAPNSATHALTDAFGLVLQAGGSDGGTIRTILVPSDFRVRSINLS